MTSPRLVVIFWNRVAFVSFSRPRVYLFLSLFVHRIQWMEKEAGHRRMQSKRPTEKQAAALLETVCRPVNGWRVSNLGACVGERQPMGFRRKGRSECDETAWRHMKFFEWDWNYGCLVISTTRFGSLSLSLLPHSIVYSLPRQHCSSVNRGKCSASW